MTGGPAAFLRELRRAAGWHRRLLAAGLAAASVAFALHALSPPAPPLAPVLVAARDLPGGAWLTAEDVTYRRLPPAAVPARALTTEPAAVGRLLASAIGSGEPITDLRLLDPALLRSLSPGQIAAPVRVTDGEAVALLRPGDVVDVVAASPAAETGSGGRAVVVAPAVRVLTVPAPREGMASSEGALVLLGVREEVALALARAAVSARLSILLRPA